MKTAYALISPEGNITKEEFDIDVNVGVKPGWKWLPIETTNHGPYNPETQYIEGPLYDIQEDKIVKYWNIHNKTQEEINNGKMMKIEGLGVTLLTILLDQHNRINNSTLSLSEYKTYLRDLI